MDETSASQIHARLRLARRGGRHHAVERRVHSQLHRAERRPVRRRTAASPSLSDGLVSALFDNGERRPIYRIPLADVRQSDGLEAQTGNVSEHHRGLRQPDPAVADSGPAGQIVQSSLEASTADIGKEFTDMIVVDRVDRGAQSKIISTADEMLDELVHIKR